LVPAARRHRQLPQHDLACDVMGVGLAVALLEIPLRVIGHLPVPPPAALAAVAARGTGATFAFAPAATGGVGVTGSSRVGCIGTWTRLARRGGSQGGFEGRPGCLLSFVVHRPQGSAQKSTGTSATGSAGLSTCGPMPSFSLIFFSISSARSGLSLRKLRAFSLPCPSWSPS